MQLQRLKAMAVFAAVVQTGSFNKAAVLLGLSRPAVSEQIRKLEALLKVRVLQRSTRMMSLTPDGEKILPLAQSVLDSLLMTERVLSKDEMVGKICLTTTYDIAHNWLLPRIKTFSEQYPNIEFDFLITDDKVDLIKNQVDLAVRVSAMSEYGFVARKVFDDELEVYAAPQYLQSLSEPISDENLLEQRWILLKRLTENGDIWLQNGTEKRRFTPINPVQTNSPIFSRDLILSGMGIGLLINNITSSYIDSGELVRVLPGWKAQQLSCYLLYPSREHLPKRMRLLINFLLNSKSFG
ncbi:LysR family transcriptional regulator [Vibrio sagamiensis]|uniref:HTH-type transcriptional regulator PtxR n=1 Tax=Vibrio sagamiensis NBRC 104589 TaxID=1219064 RepID=A0A511QIY2_9VIBR|nr:LysR family transcriptional regulator [Vibrio sagamiensis]PNQ60277.1 LysR family transcriptional regulator [Vibrio agarivorans]GEM77288.1 HTH-type transcriptional regulator PtxR [Vibrio sagamiensis NBRC 104589]